MQRTYIWKVLFGSRPRFTAHIYHVYQKTHSMVHTGQYVNKIMERRIHLYALGGTDPLMREPDSNLTGTMITTKQKFGEICVNFN